MSNYQTSDYEEVARIFKALSSPKRLMLLLRLAGCCGSPSVLSLPAGKDEATSQACCCVSEMGAGLDISPSTLSHHVKELADSGLIETKKRGKHIDCWLKEGALNKVLQLVGPLLAGKLKIDPPISGCCVIVKQRKPTKEVI